MAVQPCEVTWGPAAQGERAAKDQDHGEGLPRTRILGAGVILDNLCWWMARAQLSSVSQRAVPGTQLSGAHGLGEHRGRLQVGLLGQESSRKLKVIFPSHARILGLLSFIKNKNSSLFL